MGYSVSSRRHAGLSAEKAIEVAEVGNAAVKRDLNNFVVGHFELTHCVCYSDVVYVGSRGHAEVMLNRSRDMLATASA